VIGEAVSAELPMPAVIAEGKLVTSNIGEITPRFDKYLESINTELATDQDFANAKEDAKQCRAMAKKLRSVSEQILSQMVSIAEVQATLKHYEGLMDSKGLSLEKLVKAQTDLIKKTAITDAINAFYDHVNECTKTHGLPIDYSRPDFAGAIKGVRTVESMQSRINDLLASQKASVTGDTKDINTKLAYIDEAIKGHEHLHDRSALVTKDLDYIKLHIESVAAEETARLEKIKADAEAAAEKKRIAEQEAAQEAERERIEEQRRAQEATEDFDQQEITGDGTGTAAKEFSQKEKVAPATIEEESPNPVFDDAAEHYVLVVEDDSAGRYPDGTPIVWEHTLPNTLDVAKRMKQAVGDKYGRTRIAKLQWVD